MVDLDVTNTKTHKHSGLFSGSKSTERTHNYGRSHRVGGATAITGADPGFLKERGPLGGLGDAPSGNFEKSKVKPDISIVNLQMPRGKR